MSENSEESTWVIITLLVLILFPIIFIAGLSIGLEVEKDVSFSPDSISSWVAAIATLMIAVLTFFLAKDTWHLKLAQINQINELKKDSIKPNIELYLLSTPVSFQFMNVHIENNGKGIAKDIQFFFSGKNKKLDDNEKKVIEKFLKFNIMKNGMSSLGAGKERRSYIFSFFELSESLGESVFNLVINVKIKYKDIDSNPYEVISIIDFSEYKGVSEIGGGDPIHNIYKETEKIRRIMEGYAGISTSKRLNVNLFTSKDRDSEQAKMEKQIQEFQK